MAATNGYAGAKLEFRSSVVKKNTEFYKNFVAKKLNDENFKWPECPFKFITKNHLIGTIQSPNRSENVFVDNDDRDGPQSPSSSHSLSSSPRPSTSNQLMNDMVKLVKGEKSGVRDEAKSETISPKVEAQAPAIQYTIIQYPFNPMNGPINSMPNAMSLPNILGMPPQTWGNATPAHNPAATPIHPANSNQLAIEHDHETNPKNRAKLIPLESDFEVDHVDPRTKPQSGPRPVLFMYKTTSTMRFIETYKRTNRNVTNGGDRRTAHANRVAKDLHNELMHKKLQTQKVLKNATAAEAVPDSDGESNDSDLSPSYEPLASNDETLSTNNGTTNPETIVPLISSENDSDASHGTAEFHPYDNDGSKKEKSSRSAKKRRRSRSSSKHDKHRSSDKHARAHTSKLDRSRNSVKHEKRRSSDKHERSRTSEKRGRSRSTEKHESKRKRVSPLRINKRNNTVVNKDETSQDERVVANKENKAPACTSAYAHSLGKDDSLEANLENLFSGPRRVRSSSFHLDELFPTVSSSPEQPGQADHTEMSIDVDADKIETYEMAGESANDMNSVVENNDAPFEMNDDHDALDEMDILKMSQSPIDEDDAQAVKAEEDCDDSSDDSSGEEIMMEAENVNSTPPSNTQENFNQVNASTKSHCVLCTFQRDDAKKLVAHYKNAHPDNEVYVSRMTDSRSESVKNSAFLAIIGDDSVQSDCPFCDETMLMTVRNWITHFTEHTGEFEYRCTKCALLHTSNTHDKCDDAIAITVIEHTMENGVLRAYMCRLCNFMQLGKTRMINHLSNEHHVNVDCVDAMIQEFILLRSLSTAADVQKVKEVARELAQVNSAVLPFNMDNNRAQASLDLDANENKPDNVLPSVEADHATPETVEREIAAEVADAEIEEKSDAPSSTTETPAVPAASVLSPDSKATSALLAAKEQYPSERPLEERMQNAIFHETIELSSSDDDEPEPNKPQSPIMMSCYSVVSSDEE